MFYKRKHTIKVSVDGERIVVIPICKIIYLEQSGDTIKIGLDKAEIEISTRHASLLFKDLENDINRYYS